MAAPKIKYVQLMRVPLVRKRDGAELTHRISIGLTTDEALLLAELFAKSKTETVTKPTVSLIRAAMLQIAHGSISEDTLIHEMMKWRVREDLAATLSQREVDRALNLLAQPKKPEPKPEPKKERRVYIPEPRRR